MNNNYGSVRTMQLSKLLRYYFGSDEPTVLASVFSNMKKAAMAQSLYNGVSKQKKTADINSRIDELDRSAAEFAESEGASIDEMTENPQFMRYLVNNGLSVRDAYYLANRELLGSDAVKRAREELTESILAKKDRISENAADARTARRHSGKRASELTAAEIDDIVRRVRNGEKISF
jgi:hypothetical protein